MADKDKHARTFKFVFDQFKTGDFTLQLRNGWKVDVDEVFDKGYQITVWRKCGSYHDSDYRMEIPIYDIRNQIIRDTKGSVCLYISELMDEIEGGIA